MEISTTLNSSVKSIEIAKGKVLLGKGLGIAQIRGYDSSITEGAADTALGILKADGSLAEILAKAPGQSSAATPDSVKAVLRRLSYLMLSKEYSAELFGKILPNNSSLKAYTKAKELILKADGSLAEILAATPDSVKAVLRRLSYLMLVNDCAEFGKILPNSEFDSRAYGQAKARLSGSEC